MPFSENAERRILDSVRAYERAPRDRSRRPDPPRALFPVYIGRTTTAVTPRIGDKPGSGMVQRRLFNGTDFSKSIGQPIKVWNDSQSTTTWPANVVVKFTIVDGHFFFLTGDCAAG